jgi:hypothetical protein
LRTVIQADGDVLCFIDERRTSGDDTLWRAHVAAVEAFLSRSASAVAVVDGLLGRLTLTLTLAVTVTFGVVVDRLWGAIIGIGIACVGTGATRLERAARLTSSRLARIVLRVVVAAVLTAAVAVIAEFGRPADLLYLVGGTVPGLLLSWAVHWLVLRSLGATQGHVSRRPSQTRL